MSDKKSEHDFDVRVVLALYDQFAKAVNDNGLEYAQDDASLDEDEVIALQGLQDALAEMKGTLTNVMRDFEYYVQASDAHDAPANPMLDWSRDATTNERAQAHYQSKFVVTVKAGQKVFDSETAEDIASMLRTLESKGAVKEVRVDSSNPAKNPPIPQKYFDAQP